MSQRYEKLSGAPEHDDTSSDATVRFADDEEARWKEGFERDAPRDRRQAAIASVSGRLKPFRWLVEVGLVGIILLLLVDRIGGEEYEGAGDITGFAPEFSQTVVSFELNRDFIPEQLEDFFGDDVHQNWVDLVPPGLGFVEVKDPSNYDGLPTPLYNFPNKTVYTTSMTHQLHCLHAIVDSYARLALGQPTTHDAWHVQHCFDYLRQAIMCCGDVALEGAETTFPEGKGGSDGWDARHVCKGYGEVYEYLKGARATDHHWI